MASVPPKESKSSENDSKPGEMKVFKPLAHTQHKRSNSTSSIWAQSSIIDPKLSDLLSSVSTMLHCQMMKDAGANADKLKVHPYFCEEHYTGKEVKEIPSVKTIYNFFKEIFQTGQFSSECCVIMIIYINRLNGVTSLPLTQSNLKPVSVSALVLAQKVWDDTPLINADFSVLYPALRPKDVNNLERRFLELLDFKLSISPSLYAQYFYELRSICEEHSNSLKPLSKSQEQRLAKRTHLAEVYQRNKPQYKKKTMTVDDLRTRPKRVVLS